jgi:hypothetical protein
MCPFHLFPRKKGKTTHLHLTIPFHLSGDPLLSAAQQLDSSNLSHSLSRQLAGKSSFSVFLFISTPSPWDYV